MSYVNVKILPTPYNIEFKCVGRLIFDINYMGYTRFESKRWHNSKGQVHRKNGPAVTWDDGEQWWYRYGNLHRENGPAVIWDDGEQYWFNGIYYPKEEFNKEMRRRNELRESKNLTKTP